MKKTVVTLGIALVSLLAAPAFAQSKGDVDVEQSKAAPSKSATAKEKADAKAARIAVGKTVAKTHGTPAEGDPTTDAKTGIPKAERQAAAAKRRAAAADAVKRKETPSGDK